MSIDPTVVSRRAVLVAGAGGTLALAAACSAGSSQPSSPGGSSPAGSGPAAAEPLVKLDEVTIGQAVSVKLPDGSPGIVARPTAATAACFSAICTHEGCTVKPAGTILACPCHGSEYNAVTGAVLRGPAPAPLKKVDVTVTNGEVVPAAG